MWRWTTARGLTWASGCPWIPPWTRCPKAQNLLSQTPDSRVLPSSCFVLLEVLGEIISTGRCEVPTGGEHRRVSLRTSSIDAHFHSSCKSQFLLIKVNKYPLYNNNGSDGVLFKGFLSEIVCRHARVKFVPHQSCILVPWHRAPARSVFLESLSGRAPIGRELAAKPRPALVRGAGSDCSSVEVRKSLTNIPWRPLRCFWRILPRWRRENPAGRCVPVPAARCDHTRKHWSSADFINEWEESVNNLIKHQVLCCFLSEACSCLWKEAGLNTRQVLGPSAPPGVKHRNYRL